EGLLELEVANVDARPGLLARVGAEQHQLRDPEIAGRGRVGARPQQQHLDRRAHASTGSRVRARASRAANASSTCWATKGSSPRGSPSTEAAAAPQPPRELLRYGHGAQNSGVTSR